MINSWLWAHVIESLKQHLTLFEPYEQIIVGYSGGLDSTVLLHLLASHASLRDKVTAVHVNHQLHPDASYWERHCQEIAESLALPFHSNTVTIPMKPQHSLEEEARNARYTVFEQYLRHGSCLTLGHHQVDQAETVLLQLMRGSGIQGLSGMPMIREKKNYHIIRPLLSCDKKALKQYADLQALNWIEDPSNQNIKFRRNYIRHHILPQLNRYFPNAAKQLSRSASLHQNTLSALDELVTPYYEKCVDNERQLRVSTLLAASLPIQQVVLRKWLRVLDVRPPNSRRLNTFLMQLTSSRQDKAPSLVWSGTVVKYFQDKLYVTQNHLDKKAAQYADINWDPPYHPLCLPNQLGILKLIQQQSNNRFSIPANSQVTIRFRIGGERIYLNNCHQKLKKLFQMWSIPPWIRDTIPLIYIDNTLAAIPGYCISDHFDKLHPESYHLIHVS